MKTVYFIAILFLGFTLLGCSASKTKISEKFETETEVETKLEVPTPEEQMDLALARIQEEMRVYDVNVHHETLFSEIEKQSEGHTEEEVRAIIKEVVTTYMDDYFWDQTNKILMEYNENYALSDAETIFNRSSRTALYELIELYEWTYYQKNH